MGMSLSIGIVGLPNVGKSTVFNALSGAQNAQVANYPFCTIHPNRAVVPVPDIRLDRLAELVKSPHIIHSTIEFLDIAGLVSGASKGEGLGNQFLAQIRDTGALLHVVRCFHDPNVVHVSANPAPRQDIEIIKVELALADMEQIDRKLDRLQSALKGERKLLPMYEMCERLHDLLASGVPASRFENKESELFQEINHELRLLTNKPMIIVANVDENSNMTGNPYLLETITVARESGHEVVVISAYLEQELSDMTVDERREYLALSGIESTGLDQVIRTGFGLLNLISFFTFNEKEARAWNIVHGSNAPKAAGAIHTDFERGFIRAEVIPFDVFNRYGSHAAVKAAGMIQVEGKDYIVQDGDIIYFRFNV